ncbi:MAG TPA: transposase [Gaiellaceae bacterium]|nr:transposase [Gaiellaceae bacterium]
MPRPIRILLAGGIYHVMNRGNRREPIFCSDGDFILFRELLGQVARERQWIIHAFCLMPNHYHVLVETPKADLSVGIQRLNGEYASWFNRCYGLVGHVFQGRYRSSLIESDGQFLHTVRYIAQNPVRAGLADSPAGWRWSSYADVVAKDRRPLSDRLLRSFAREPSRALALLRAFVEDVA